MVSRCCVARLSECVAFRLTCAGTHPLPGSRDWLLAVTTTQRLDMRGYRGRGQQPSGMAGHVSPYNRIPFFHERGPGVGVDLSLQERLDELFAKESNKEKVNIGFKRVSGEQVEKDLVNKWRKETRKNRALEKAAREGTLKVNIDKVQEEWKSTGASFEDIHRAGELYGIYEDLFRHGYFYPCVDLEVAYAQEDDLMVPVYRGNHVKPNEAAAKPEVRWTSKEDDLWCLVLTGLDSHLTEEGQEYLHWMVGNIKGSDLGSGEEIANYLQPFPPFGTGYHRFAFVLYKQAAKIEFSPESISKGEIRLSERTFNTFEFYSKHQESLTPAGLAFFQSDYHPSLRDFFHNTLNMKEPRYEYEFPLPYIRQWNVFHPKTVTKGFNEFLDRHRDPKDIEKEVLVKKLKHTHPYHGDLEAGLNYPLAHEEDLKEVFPPPIGDKPLQRRQSYKIPSWRREAILREKSKHGYFESTDHSELRKDPLLSQ